MQNRTLARPPVVAALVFLTALVPVLLGAWLLRGMANKRDTERFNLVLAEATRAVTDEQKRYFDYFKQIALDAPDLTQPGAWQHRRETEEWRQRFPHLDSIGYAAMQPEGLRVRFVEVREKSRFIAGEEFTVSSAAVDRSRTSQNPEAAGDGVRATMLFRVLDNAPGGANTGQPRVLGFVFGEVRWAEWLGSVITRAAAGRLENSLLAPDVPDERGSYVRTSFITALGQTARVRYAAGPAFWRDSQQRQPWLLLGCGVPLAGVLAFSAAAQARRRATLEMRVVERTAELSIARDRLAESLTHERELNAMKTNFISMVTHELRTPLSVIQSSADILALYLERLPLEQRAEHFKAISKAVTRVTDLSEEVLLFSRIEAQRMQLRLAPLELVVFCAALVREQLSATSEKCRIVFDAAPGLPVANADERLLRHILVNLLGNAVKYSPENAEVRLALSRNEADAVFTIADCGIGIPAEEQPRLFQSFFRSQRVGHLPGTGLGLVIVKRCVELHGGSIEFTSEENHGTTFTVRMPLFAENLRVES